MYSAVWISASKLYDSYFSLVYKQLFAADEDETDLSNNFVVKTCQKFIPVTGNYLVFLCI